MESLLVLEGPLPRSHDGMVQCELHSGTSRLVTWLDRSLAVEGRTVTLSDSPEPGRWWRIKRVF